ncbi:MAG TPA: UDP-N-acetylmuramoyl-L-alanine--D-glutamate ligase [Gammaproteobacteria bacterium]|nr:UDP-N-acetylmuramoyl-L-alanine--D-glutamate ligase [Gammaproteobacteria bacterium]
MALENCRQIRTEPQREIVVGLGETGLSCARFLARSGAQVTVMDSRDMPPALQRLRRELPGVEAITGRFDAELLRRARRLVVSPGVALRDPPIAAAIEAGVPVVGDIELFARSADAPVIAITGSNGKSTVTELVGAMARQADREVLLGGNLGTPALDLLREERPDFYVLELSSFQLETTSSLNARAAVVLNVSADHLDRYRSMEEYSRAKQRIYRGDGVMVINADDARVARMAQGGRSVVRFGSGQPQPGDFGLRDINGESWLARGEELILPVRELRIPGRHNQLNALAALALGEAMGLPLDSMREALRDFRGLPHRTEWIAELDGVNWYNDSKATNVGATLAALNGVEGQVVLIAGGEGKGADFSTLCQAIAAKARAVILMGRDASLMARVLEGMAPVEYASRMEEAVALARRWAEPGDSVLLSPACASFDMYSGFEERGRAFVAALTRLMREEQI